MATEAVVCNHRSASITISPNVIVINIEVEGYLNLMKRSKKWTKQLFRRKPKAT
ncbi:hypothetical protein OKW41_000438 [Paraburkholderia sp. UCT70]